MKVYKFGGASVKDTSGIINLERIVSGEKGNLVIVVSAFGKTTNALEKVLKTWLSGDKSWTDHLENIRSYHLTVAQDLFPSVNTISGRISDSFLKLKEYLKKSLFSGFDFEYDQIVSFGELWSTMIVAEYLATRGYDVKWIDIRENLLTNDTHRDAGILWDESSKRILQNFDFSKNRIIVTQGFIGGTLSGNSSTLGREGSDFTAAILANILNAESVTVWKDVPGLLNADPKWMPDAEKMDEISYKEAVEMTFSGAKVIHPKTIKPLHNKSIPLYVKSFINPSLPGTVVKADALLKNPLPVYIRKENQILISILPKDFSFVMGENLTGIFRAFANHGIKVNLVEASAISINVCVDDEREKVDSLISDIKAEFTAFFNENLEMLTIRHYTPESINRVTSGREVLIEQRNRSTVRFVARTITSQT